MSSRVAILGGLVSGVLVAGIVLGGLVALGSNEPVAASSPSPDATASVEPSSTVTPTASGPAPSGSDPSGAPSGSPTGLFHIGEAAPPLLVPQVGGGTIDLAALRGQPVWVSFMGTYCPPCQDEFPLMNGFAARYGDAGLIVVAIDIKEDEGTVAAFATSLGAIFPMGLDEDGSSAAAWDAIALPVHFWIDREGIVRDGALGGIGPDIMARGVQSILPEVVVTP